MAAIYEKCTYWNLFSVEFIMSKVLKRPLKNKLRECFKATLKGHQVSFQLKSVFKIFKQQLHVDLGTLENGLRRILPHMLIYHLNKWPGWSRNQEYIEGKLSINAWYKELVSYLRKQLIQIRKTYKKAMMELERDKAIQTEISLLKPNSPFSIHLVAPPWVTNNFLFVNNKMNILLKHHSPLEWQNFINRSARIKQVFSWPHVAVLFLCPVLSFSRKNAHEYQRYLTLVENHAVAKPLVEFIEQIEVVSKSRNRVCYTVDWIEDLATKILQGMMFQKMGHLTEVYEILMNEFLEDIRELGIMRNGKPTIATNTRVTFNINKSSYYRNKKAVSASNNVGFNEIIVPKVQIVLSRVEDDKEIEEYLSDLRNPVSKCALPKLSLICTYCKCCFNTIEEIMHHFMQLHTMELGVKCFSCKKDFKPLFLSLNRWGHSCTDEENNYSRAVIY